MSEATGSKKRARPKSVRFAENVDKREYNINLVDFLHNFACNNSTIKLKLGHQEMDEIKKEKKIRILWCWEGSLKDFDEMTDDIDIFIDNVKTQGKMQDINMVPAVSKIKTQLASLECNKQIKKLNKEIGQCQNSMCEIDDALEYANDNNAKLMNEYSQYEQKLSQLKNRIQNTKKELKDARRLEKNITCDDDILEITITSPRITCPVREGMDKLMNNAILEKQEVVKNVVIRSFMCCRL